MRPITIRMNRKKRMALKMLAIGIGLLLIVFLVDWMVRPMITTVFIYQAKLTATRSINDAVLEVITQEQIDYHSIIKAREDADGKVTFLETNMVTMNRLKAEIANLAAEKLNDQLNQEVTLPLGTLLGSQIFSGRGPEVTFLVLPVGYVQTDFYNEFQSAGINQTLHQIMLTVTVPVSAVMPGYTITTDVTTEICIAETVIVGEVPQSFTDISGDQRSTLDKFNDYKAKPLD